MIDKSKAWCYFDGVASGNPYKGGSGGMLYLSDCIWYKFVVNIGPTTKNMTYLFAIHLNLKLAIQLNINQLQVFKNSLFVIDWINYKTHPNNICLTPLMADIRRLIPLLSDISF